MLTVWAVEGRGIVVKPRFEVADALAAGQLVPVLERHPPRPMTLAVLYPARQLVPLKVKTFADMLVDDARAMWRGNWPKSARSCPPEGRGFTNVALPQTARFGPQPFHPPPCPPPQGGGLVRPRMSAALRRQSQRAPSPLAGEGWGEG